MSKSEALAMYVSDVRAKVGHELAEWYIDLIVDCFDDDVTVEECEQMIDTFAERAWERQQERLMEGDGGPTISEQYAAAWAEKRELRMLK